MLLLNARGREGDRTRTYRRLASGAIDLKAKLALQSDVMQVTHSHPALSFKRVPTLAVRPAAMDGLKKFRVTEKPRREPSMKPSKEGNEVLSSA